MIAANHLFAHKSACCQSLIPIPSLMFSCDAHKLPWHCLKQVAAVKVLLNGKIRAAPLELIRAEIALWITTSNNIDDGYHQPQTSHTDA